MQNHSCRCSGNKFGRTIIHRQRNGPKRRKFLLHIKHQLRLCSTESVNGLIIIPNYKQIVSRCCKHPDHFILHTVDILEFIDQDILETLLPSLQNLRLFPEKCITLYQHIIKIKFFQFFFLMLIAAEHFCKLILCKILTVKIFQMTKSVLYHADFPQKFSHQFLFIFYLRC